MKKLFYGLIMITIFIGLVACGRSNVDDPVIKVYTRDTTSGTRDGFFSNIDFKEAATDNTVLVKGYIEVAGNGEMIRAIKNDENGIGYISLSSLSGSGLKGLEFNNVKPTEANVLNGSYGLKRNFNYIIRNEFSTPDEEEIVKAFIAYLNTKEGKATIIANGGIVELKETDPLWNDIKGDHPVALKNNSAITIKFGGSTSVEKIVKALVAGFSLKCGNFQFEQNYTGSGDAFKRTQGSEKDGANKLHIGFASREFKLTSSEPATSGTYGTFSIDAIVTVVNQNNKISNITSETLKNIYQGNISNWSELN